MFYVLRAQAMRFVCSPLIIAVMTWNVKDFLEGLIYHV
jgi:hypothetical protein